MSKISHYSSPALDEQHRNASANDLPEDVTEAELAEFISLLIEGDRLAADEDDFVPGAAANSAPSGGMRPHYGRAAISNAELGSSERQHQCIVDFLASLKAPDGFVIMEPADRLVREDRVMHRLCASPLPLEE